MFHTFAATTQSSDPAASTATSREAKPRRKISTTHACDECRRRKIGCDGGQPCSNCDWYRNGKQCRYSHRPAREAPSQRLLAQLSTSLDQAHAIIARLLPQNRDMRQLNGLSRAQLVDMVLAASPGPVTGTPGTNPQSSPSIPSPATATSQRVVDPELEELVYEASPHASWTECRTGLDGVPHVSDDVNALSLSIRPHSSFLGVSSIAASLRVIRKISKARTLEGPSLTSTSRVSALSERYPSAGRVGETPILVPATSLGQRTLIDAYFNHFHPLIPMIDKGAFMDTYESGLRTDDGWLALLHMVFTLGSIAASTAEDMSHIHYYNLVKPYVNIDFLGNGNIEAVQALGLIGGLYLHYQSRPNTAHAVMGAAVRMACALGLHRDADPTTTKAQSSTPAREAHLPSQETRRRTWWSLFCLDTWATTTVGRPSLGRISPAVTARLPGWLHGEPDLSKPEKLDEDDLLVLILRHEVTFCKIATKIQDRLAEGPVLDFAEIGKLDSELRDWEDTLPQLLKGSQECPSLVATPRAVIKWRYNNLRFLLFRPILLVNALRSSMPAHMKPSDDEIKCVTTCRTIAARTIQIIRDEWRQTQVSGWNAVWLLFQACMAPLVTLFSELNRGDMAAVDMARAQIETAIALLADMSSYSVTAHKTRFFVTQIYDTFHAALDAATHQAGNSDTINYAAVAPSATDDDQKQTAVRLPVGIQPPAQSSEDFIPQLSSHVSHNIYQSFIEPGGNPMYPDPAERLELGQESSNLFGEGGLDAFWSEIIWGEGDDAALGNGMDVDILEGWTM